MNRTRSQQAMPTTTTPRFAAMAALACASALLASLPGAEARTGVPTGALRVGDVEAVVELAASPDDAHRGLSGRDAVARGTDGMLFPAWGVVGFGMAGMRFCLDMIWIADDAVIGVTDGACPVPGAPDEAQPVFYPPGPVTAVLEAPARWAADRGVETGDAVGTLVVPADNVAGMVRRAGRNGRFGENETAAIVGVLTIAGVDASRLQPSMAERMERANAGGVTGKEVRRIQRQARVLLADVGGPQ